MADKATKTDLKKLSEAELMKMAEEHKAVKLKSLFKLRSRESHEQKLYKQSKKLVAQINTELTARRLLNSNTN